jgi:hypothetical protein
VLQEANLDNPIVQGAIEEGLNDKVPPERFWGWLVECLTSSITCKRGDAPEEVAILNDKALLNQISEQYKQLYQKQLG